MAAMSRGKMRKAENAQKVFRVKKGKGGTPSSRNHHFESFSQRVARLKIDPVRRARSTYEDLGSVPDTFTYLGKALEEWMDLNMSETFSAFSRELQPYCESLPQVLHYQDRIRDLLVQYISKHDGMSLEPILSLLSHFAHDLGSSFEAHFARAVSAIATLAAQHSDVQVVEWSFNCLAWIFKFLSRLLVPDLRPTYDLMAPLLGKTKQKAFVTKFAAEAMSFLVRKAGSVYYRDQRPLRTVIAHIFEELSEQHGESSRGLYNQGLMVLFAEAIKGVQNGVHTAGPAILKILLDHLLEIRATSSQNTRTNHATEIFEGVLINVMHHTQAKTFQPLMNDLLEVLPGKQQTLTPGAAQCATRVFYLLICVRKGTRMEDWTPLLSKIVETARIVDSQEALMSDAVLSSVIESAAAAVQFAPLDALLPFSQTMFDIFQKGCWRPFFVKLCNIVNDLDTDRFKALLLPQFERFIIANWGDIRDSNEDNDDDVFYLLAPKFNELGHLRNMRLSCLLPWLEHVKTALRTILSDPHHAHARRVFAKCSTYFKIIGDAKPGEELQDSIKDLLMALIQSALQDRQQHFDSDFKRFALGECLLALVNSFVTSDFDYNTLWPALCLSVETDPVMPLHLEGVLAYLRAASRTLDLRAPEVDNLVEGLVRNLATPSHRVRSLSLQILDKMYEASHGSRSDALEIALAVEEMPPSLESARAASMHVRRLASGYNGVIQDPWLRRAMASYCYGLLHVNLAQLRDDAYQALKSIADSRDGEEMVSALVFSKLRAVKGPEVNPIAENSSSTSYTSLTDYQCTSLIQMDSAFRESQNELLDPSDKLERRFEDDHGLLNVSSRFDRTKALMVLSKIPQLAEKRSRLLVPILLSWVNLENDDDNLVEVDTGYGSRHDKSASVSDTRWSRKDRKDMLAIFAQFTNPTALHKSQEVYRSLLTLLANGDAEIQKSAFKAICSWKSASTKPYEENIVNLLDDARFRDELSVFFHVGEGDSVIREEHRKELMPIVLRVLYGRLVSRTGSTSSGRGQEARRKAVFVALSRLRRDEMEQFLRLVLWPLDNIDFIGDDGKMNEDSLLQELMSTRRQSGLVRMLDDMLDTLGSQLLPFVSQLSSALLYCLVRSSRALRSVDVDSTMGEQMHAQTSLLRAVRKVGLRTLNRLFVFFPQFEWQAYLPTIFNEIITPRLETISVDNAQSVSGILQLFSTWSSSSSMVYFLTEYESNLLEKVSQCLEMASVKDEVKVFVLDDVLKNVVALAAENGESSADVSMSVAEKVQELVLRPNAHHFLRRTGNLLRKGPSKGLLESGIRTVSQLASFVEVSSEARNLIEIAIFLLKQPSRRVNARTKSDVLRILDSFVPRSEFVRDDSLFEEAFTIVSSLFAYFQDRGSRQLLVDILGHIAQKDPELRVSAITCADINAFSASRLDEPDFDRRARAYHNTNEEKYLSLSPRQWQPILYNMLYYIRDADELAIRTSASFALRRLVESCSQKSGPMNEELQHWVIRVLLPAINKGIHEKAEVVRMEYLSVMAHIIRLLPGLPPVSDMEVLLMRNDEDASFFANILHIQQHRRLRALRRLSSAAEEGIISSENASHFFIPLVEHFIFDRAEDENAHNLAAEAVRVVGVLAESIEWPHFRALFRKYTSYIESKPDTTKTVVRLLGNLADALDRARLLRGYNMPARTNDAVDGESESSPAGHKRLRASVLSRTLTSQDKLSHDLQNNFLQPLLEYVHDREESTVGLRAPVAVAVVKLLQLLPVEQIPAQLTPLLTDLCHVLRSRAQDSRDLIRKTLAEIAVLIGPGYFGFLLKELRSALLRGYQLHVLSFTLHSILVCSIPTFGRGDLDHCLPDIVAVIMDDIFGSTGQEKEAEDYVSKMKEVKSSKSYDSMELIAKVVTLQHMSSLVRPIQALLSEKLDLKMVKKIDELLRRLGLGILHNEAVHNHDVLVFCYQVVQDVYKDETEFTDLARRVDYRRKRYLMNMKGVYKSNLQTSASYKYKLVRWALDVLRYVLRKHDSLQTPSNLAGFMPIVGDALVQGQEDVQMSAFRLLTSIIKVPLSEVDSYGPVYASEAVRVLKAAPSTNTELAQAALKFIAAILRERRDVEFREADVAYLLKRLKPDFEEPDRQGITFNFLKAVIGRKFVIPEVYEIMDTVASLMITNHTRGTRDLARNVYYQFLIEYPQSKDRFAKQLAFLVKNLGYKYVEGRQSVMELVNMVLAKIEDDLVQDALATFFVPLVMLMVNDESSLCREMAGALVKRVFERANPEQMKNFTSLLKGWLSQDEQALLTRVTLQCWMLSFETQIPKEKDTTLVLQRVSTILRTRVQLRDQESWELLYYALQTFAKLCKFSPEICFAPGAAHIWNSTFPSLSFPHAWVKLSAAKLLGSYFADFAAHNADIGLAQLPLIGSGGLHLFGEDMITLTRLSLNSLNVPGVSEELATQAVRNLVFLGRCFGVNGLEWAAPRVAETPHEVNEEVDENIDFPGIDDQSEEELGHNDEISLSQDRTALKYLFRRLYNILRREPLTTRAYSLAPHTASLQLLGALCHVLDVAAIERSLKVILLTVQRFTDTSIATPSSTDPAFTTSYQALVNTAQETISLLQKKVGTTEFVRALQVVREHVKERRDERRAKRALERVTEPEKVGRIKRRKMEVKKEKRKEKGMQARGRRRGW